MTLKGTGNPVNDLNRSFPAAATAQLGTRVNELAVAVNAILAKLDAIGAAGASSAAIATAAGTTNVATNKVTPISSL